MDIVYAKGPNCLIWILRSLKIECRASSFIATFVIKCASATALSHNILLLLVVVVLVVLVVVFNPYKSRFCFLFLLIHEQTNTKKVEQLPYLGWKEEEHAVYCLSVEHVYWNCVLIIHTGEVKNVYFVLGKLLLLLPQNTSYTTSSFHVVSFSLRLNF